MVSRPEYVLVSDPWLTSGLINVFTFFGGRGLHSIWQLMAQARKLVLFHAILRWDFVSELGTSFWYDYFTRENTVAALDSCAYATHHILPSIFHVPNFTRASILVSMRQMSNAFALPLKRPAPSTNSISLRQHSARPLLENGLRRWSQLVYSKHHIMVYFSKMSAATKNSKPFFMESDGGENLHQQVSFTAPINTTSFRPWHSKHTTPGLEMRQGTWFRHLRCPRIRTNSTNHGIPAPAGSSRT